jgi:hypothetical protein
LKARNLSSQHKNVVQLQFFSSNQSSFQSVQRSVSNDSFSQIANVEMVSVVKKNQTTHRSQQIVVVWKRFTSFGQLF